MGNDMMTIYFKNGMSKHVIKEIAEIIKEKLIQGTTKFQSFSDENGEVFLIINLNEIVYIA